MTGRRLYDHFCDAAAAEPWGVHATVLPHPGAPAVAWPHLSSRDRSVWNELARRITPKTRKRAA